MNKANVCILNENNWHKCLPWIKAPSSLKCVANASFQRGKNKRWLLFDFFFFLFGWWWLVFGLFGLRFELCCFFFLVHLFIFVCCFFSSPCSGFRVISSHRSQGICLHVFYLLIWELKSSSLDEKNACKRSPTRDWMLAGGSAVPGPPPRWGRSNVGNTWASGLLLSIRDPAETSRLVSPQTEVEVRSERWKGNILSIKKPKAFGLVPEQQTVNHRIPTGGFMAELQRW